MEDNTLGGIVVLLLLAGAFFGWLFFLAPIEYPEPLTQPAKIETSISDSTATQTKWYHGGTLHRATIAQWRVATNANRLATASDWLVASLWKGSVNSTSDFNRLRIKAQILVNAVNEAVRDTDQGSTKAAEIAAMILVISNDLGP
jgi:hypothetical protein